MKKIITCLLATLGLTAACGQANYEDADVRGFSELIEDSGVVLLDVRTAAEYAEGNLCAFIGMTKCHSVPQIGEGSALPDGG